MKLPALFFLLAGATHATIQGLTISHYQTHVNFTEAHSMGLKFVYIKATEGTTYTDPRFSSHWADSTNASMYRGAYHLARPTTSSGAAQAKYFLSRGGGWTDDGTTLPGLLELPTECADTKPSELVDWISEFNDEYEKATGRYPVLFTRNTWWVHCTGNSKKFNEKNQLALANWKESVGMIPGGWNYWIFWQYSDNSAWGGLSDLFHGDSDALKKLAVG
ncbi:N,O-diacetylmuramidase [Massarina eburnea CBS 473.64]|uniref:N,O-diacetylmuramidase n=1 Tax=Massarina eburnea CBS 473.64 TaxID=1395130 RepID=A0A6A6RNQ3_9PLEO|nr:N,O-diacetylmuramidase [Massarina eburnea CBS 473.64]